MRIPGTGDKDFDKVLRRLRGALVTLPGTEDRLLARRNARQRVLTALRALRARLDDRFPALRAEGRTRRVLGYEGRVRSLRARGFQHVRESDAVRYAAAGVRVLYVKGKVTSPDPLYKNKMKTTRRESIWIPGWAAAIGYESPSQLREARRSTMARRAALAADALAKMR